MQTELRTDSTTIKNLSINNLKPITAEEAEKLAKSIGAVKYIECSALAKNAVKAVFDKAIRTGIEVKIYCSLVNHFPVHIFNHGFI